MTPLQQSIAQISDGRTTLGVVWMALMADGYEDIEIYMAMTEMIDAGEWELFFSDKLPEPDNVLLRKVV